jgi:transcriptional regulator with XRE-family HTH domain
MANNLRALRDGRGWSQDEAAAAFGTTRNQYAKLEGGARRLSDKWIKRASEAYGIDPGEVVTDRPASVPVAGYVGAGSEAHFYSDAQGPLDEAPAPEDVTPQTVAVEVRGDSLGPFFHGWLVYFDDVRSPVTADLLGRLCVVGLHDDRVLVKKLLRGRVAGTFDLHGQFGEPVYGAEVAWAAPVKSVVPR